MESAVTARRRRIVLLVMMILGLVACKRDQGATTEATGALETPQGAVQLLPASPTAQQDLRVIVSGGKQVAYRWYLNGQLINGESGPLMKAGRFSKEDTVSVAVTTERGETTASVTIQNTLPTMVSAMFSPEHVYAGVDIMVSPQAADADGDTVQFRIRWAVNGETQSEEGPTLRGNLFHKGDRVSLTVTPYDSDGEGETYSLRPLIIPNGPPRFVSIPGTAFFETGYRYQAKAEDPDGDPLKYSLLAAPPGMIIDGRTGLVTWPADKAPAGDHVIEIAVSDPDGFKAVQRYSLAVSWSQEGKDENP